MGVARLAVAVLGIALTIAIAVSFAREDGALRITDTRESESLRAPDPADAAERAEPDIRAAAARLRLPVMLLVVAGAGLLATRALVRRQRRYVRVRLLPYRGDEAEPEEVRRLLESWHQLLLERWWRRPFVGQPSLALELSMTRNAQRRLEGQLAVVCPDWAVATVSAALRSCYRDSQFVAPPELPALDRVIRLKKRFAFIQSLAVPEEYDRSVADAVLNQMASVEQPGLVQVVLTPTPGVFDRWARGRYSAHERRGARAQAYDPANPGMQSELLASELRGGLQVQHHALFFTDIRVAADSLRGARGVASVLRGSSVGVNRLVERYMRPYGRAPLYRRRIAAGVGNPVPGWRRGVLSSAEVAGLWHLPSPGLTSVQVQRSSIPRAVASPDVSRHPDHALARDELGEVGIRPEDKSDGLGLIGGQKTGKTSLLCRTVQVDAQDDDCALIVLMPKPGDALKALSMVPTRRTVHFLDFEQPEIGINPLLSSGAPAMVADKIVEAFRDVNAEGDIKGSSDRFLRQAAQAALGASRAGVLPGPPTLWDMYRMLLPGEVTFREQVVQALYSDPRFTDTVTFFGRDLPNDLRDAMVNTTSKLDAPRNKLLRLLVDSLDTVLRHPLQIDLDAIVRNREVLIVDGKMGTFGPDNCRVMMQFILNMLYGALQRQQQLPEAERVRVALKVDEAHLIMNESFANALATLRSAGLEVVAAWQYGEQIQDPKIRAGLMSLLRQRCMFSMGESADAREMSEIAMNVYVDMIKDDPRSRARVRITPDAIYNMPNHHAICSWISRGARTPAFIAQTMPLETDHEVIEHHLAAQRDRGAYVPERLPDPLPDVALDGASGALGDMGAEVGVVVGVGAGIAPESGTAAPLARDAEVAPQPPSPPRGAEPAPPRGRSADEPRDASQSESSCAAPQMPEPAPRRESRRAGRRDADPPPPPRKARDTYTELDLDDVRGLVWDQVDLQPPDDRPQATGRELEILVALWRHQFLFSTQIWRRWWGDSSLRAAQMGLNRMARAGWVKRFRFLVGDRGAQQRVYCLTSEGFALAQRQPGPRGAQIESGAEWQEPDASDPHRILRSLHANAWMLALQQLAPRATTHWRGPAGSRLMPPRRRERGEWVEIRPEELTAGTSRRVHGLQVDRLAPVHPDATIELRLSSPDGMRRFDLLVEVERGRGGRYRDEKLRRYDALITGWCRMLERYKTLKTPPIVVFVCEDEPSAVALGEQADSLVTGQLAKAGVPPEEWPSPARRSMFFVAERDIHDGTLAAWQLAPQPPAARGESRGGDLRRVAIVDERLLRRG